MSFDEKHRRESSKYKRGIYVETLDNVPLDAPNEDSDQTAHSQSDLNLHWAHFASRKHAYIILTPINPTFI